MNELQHHIIKIADEPAWIEEAALWFASHWRVPAEAYRESMEAGCRGENPVPQWYLCLENGKIIGGLGVIENDFHPRLDLTPNVCAVFTEEPCRCRGVAGALLHFAARDMAAQGVDTLYLLTDHTGFYERYGWEYLCPVTGDGETEPSRMYRHIYEAPVIETERLFLRPMNAGDYDALYRVLADSAIMRYYPYTFDEARVRNWITRNQARYRELGFGLWAVCLNGTGEMIGDCGLTMQNINGWICPEIGYHIRADYQRRGFAKEAASAVRDWTFAHTPFAKVYSYMQADNIASAATARSYGAAEVGSYVNDGVPTLIYALEKPAK